MVSVQTKIHSNCSQAEKGAVALLYLDGTHVGTVTVKGFNASWGFGDFEPAPAFSAFAPVYAHWSTLMHSQAQDKRAGREAAEQLRRVERLLDTIHAQLYFPDSGRWVAIPQVAISDQLLEWKEY